MMDLEPKQVLPDWERLHRLVPSHFPPIGLFETVADPEDLEIIYAIEALTNDRLRDEVGDLTLVPADERIAGPGSTPVMAAFTHTGLPSRFTGGRYGVYYGARDLETAIAETVYHRERFLSATREHDTELTMRQYINKVALELHDVRDVGYGELYDPDSYDAPQAFAKVLRESGSNGLLYRSVRHDGGECVAAFRPKAVTIPVQGQHFRYVWSGHHQKVISVLSVSEIKQ
ncbi:RES family NAD+ phosphorylase [Marinobacterium aestuariivivens]|uniref:RES family NAD+ phosphorylase n=1 Tax=Marinobacterium aestuariivivens TaxID=1698799 RepID=A0ABW2A7D2_9GAMM